MHCCPVFTRTLAVVVSLSAIGACERSYTERGDLSALRERGALRIIVPQQSRPYRLPRRGHPAEVERELAAELARALTLEPRFVEVAERELLLPTLLNGEGDLVAAGLTVTDARSALVAFSEPVNRVREQIVTRLSDTMLMRPGALAGRTVAVRRSSSYWPTAERLQREHPGLSLEAVPEALDTEGILYRVAQGEYDITIADDNIVDQALGYMPELRVAFDVTGERSVAWALRPDATDLRMAVDSFLEQANLDLDPMERWTGDLVGIQRRGVIRVLMPNTAATYFVWRGELMGFEYDLARRFADRIGVRLEVIVPPTRANYISWLRQGYGDLVAAGLTPTAEREALGIAFGQPYNRVIQTVVARRDDAEVTTPADLAGRTVVVRRRSAYWGTLQRLQEAGIPVRVEAAPEELETEEIIDRVAHGDYDLTLADSHILAIELSWRDDVRAAFTVGDSVDHAWAVREEDAALTRAIDRFVRAEFRGRWFNITYRRYFETPQRAEALATERSGRTGTISPFDSLFRTYAARQELDWHLVAAQAYEESRFSPDARSFAGAVGLLQVMPSLGRAMGFDDLTDPEQNVRAGVRYLRDQLALFEDLPVAAADSLWFALASYNAGYGHIQDGRRLAARMGHDPDRWFGEVERVLPLLARAEHHEQTRYGYCRCQEPVNYVRRIRERYEAYREVLGPLEAGP